MIITLSPVRADGSTVAAVNGDVAVINGQTFHFGALAEGDTLPVSAVACPALASAVTRAGGQVRLTLIAPHGPGAPESARFPASITQDAVLPFPPDGAIDWGQVITAAQKAQASLTEWRAGASMSRTDFCLALAGAGILTPADAIAAAKGDVPAAFEPIVAALPDPPQTAVRIRWGAMQTVDRSNDFIALVAGAADISDATLDAVFGWNS